jgi:hypothetical protein
MRIVTGARESDPQRILRAMVGNPIDADATDAAGAASPRRATIVTR